MPRRDHSAASRPSGHVFLEFTPCSAHSCPTPQWLRQLLPSPLSCTGRRGGRPSAVVGAPAAAGPRPVRHHRLRRPPPAAPRPGRPPVHAPFSSSCLLRCEVGGGVPHHSLKPTRTQGFLLGGGMEGPPTQFRAPSQRVPATPTASGASLPPPPAPPPPSLLPLLSRFLALGGELLGFLGARARRRSHGGPLRYKARCVGGGAGRAL